MQVPGPVKLVALEKWSSGGFTIMSTCLTQSKEMPEGKEEDKHMANSTALVLLQALPVVS